MNIDVESRLGRRATMGVNPGPSSSSSFSNEMDPLSRVEQFLDAAITDAWPSMIIEQLFMDEPTDITMRHVASFMRGNGFPIMLANNCFNACNGMYHCYVDEKFNEWYYIYDRNPYKYHKAKYY
jgi:hypothetical protein